MHRTLSPNCTSVRRGWCMLDSMAAYPRCQSGDELLVHRDACGGHADDLSVSRATRSAFCRSEQRADCNMNRADAKPPQVLRCWPSLSSPRYSDHLHSKFHTAIVMPCHCSRRLQQQRLHSSFRHAKSSADNVTHLCILHKLQVAVIVDRLQLGPCVVISAAHKSAVRSVVCPQSNIDRGESCSTALAAAPTSWQEDSIMYVKKSFDKTLTWSWQPSASPVCPHAQCAPQRLPHPAAPPCTSPHEINSSSGGRDMMSCPFASTCCTTISKRGPGFPEQGSSCGLHTVADSHLWHAW